MILFYFLYIAPNKSTYVPFIFIHFHSFILKHPIKVTKFYSFPFLSIPFHYFNTFHSFPFLISFYFISFPCKLPNGALIDIGKYIDR